MRVLLVLAGLLPALSHPAAEPVKGGGDRPAGTIAFSSLAPRGWDLYATDLQTGQSRRLTDHPALDYNAAFSPDGSQIAFVSERDGNLELYAVRADGTGLRRLTHDFALDDHPAWSPDGKRLAFVSTRQPADKPGRAWNAVHVMNADGSDVRRVSPPDAADYSPAWSPKGDLIACASGSGNAGGTDLYVMKPDGSGRRLVVKDGGWPTFTADGQGLFFHRRHEKHWGVWRVRLDGSESERLTPADLDAYTPRACADGKRLAVAVQRGKHRQIEVLDLETGQLSPVTKEAADHWNPSIAPDGRHVVYHKAAPGFRTPNVERWGTPPGTDLTMLRLAGAFPAFSPDGKRVALTGGSFGQLDVMNLDGSARKTLYPATSRTLFSISWAHTGDLIAFSHGAVFQGPEGKVNVATIRPDGTEHRDVTADAGNNGFPSLTN